MALSRIKIETDASFISLNSLSGLAAVYTDDNGKPLMCFVKSQRCKDILNAELYAILYGLQMIPNEKTAVIVYSDSRDAVDCLNSGKDLRAKPYGAPIRRIQNLIKAKELDVVFEWRRRDNQKVADAASWKMAFAPGEEMVLYPNDFL